MSGPGDKFSAIVATRNTANMLKSGNNSQDPHTLHAEPISMFTLSIVLQG
jgi:hypothetical protein